MFVLLCDVSDIYAFCGFLYRYRWAFVPEVDVDSYDGPGTTLLEGEQECNPHVVRIMEGLQHRYGVNIAKH